MIPLILISQNDEQSELFITNFIHDKSFQLHSIYKIYPEKKEISIHQIREIKKETRYESATTRLFILFHFEKASIEAQNSLLKVLEEKTIKNNFILLAKNEYQILPTIRSRCRIVKIKLKETKKTNTSYEDDLLHRLRESENYSFLADTRIQKPTREEASKLIEEIITGFRKEYARFPTVATAVIKTAMRYKQLLEINNTNPQLTIDSLLIFIKKTFSMKS